MTHIIVFMRTTRVYSITMPPELALQAERLAKKESRTMSELMREALRRYQQPQVPLIVDVRELARNLAPTPEVLKAIRADSRRRRVDSLTMAEIDQEVAAVRKQHQKGRARAVR